MTITIKRPSSPMATNFRPAKEVGEAGEKTPIFPAGKVAIWIAKQSVARQIYGCFEMVSPPRKQPN